MSKRHFVGAAVGRTVSGLRQRQKKQYTCMRRHFTEKQTSTVRAEGTARAHEKRGSAYLKFDLRDWADRSLARTPLSNLHVISHHILA